MSLFKPQFFTDSTLTFMKKVLEISGLGQETYLPEGPFLHTRFHPVPGGFNVCPDNLFMSALVPLPVLNFTSLNLLANPLSSTAEFPVMLEFVE